MPTTYTNGLKLPDLGSIDWYNSYKNNIDILDPIVGTVNGVATTYAPISHNHSASEITSGTIDIARLPPAALERMHIVADQTARYALTTSTVQEGDTVKQTDTGVMYLVVDSTKLNSADGYTEYSAGTASKAIADEDGTSIKTGYVNVAGNQTVTGQKTWSGNQFFTSTVYHNHTSYESGNTPVNNSVSNIYLADKNSVYLGYLRNVVYSSGRTATEIRAKNAFKNGVLDPTGSEITSNLNVEVQPGGAKTIYWDGSIRNALLPYTTNTYSLGSSSYQWSSVYAQSYYYNGTAWGLDKANVWSAHQKIVGNNSRGSVSIYNPAYTKGSALSSTVLSIGSIYMGDGGQQGLANSLGFISTDLTANGTNTLLSLSAMENTASSGTRTNVVIQYDKNDAENPKKVSIGGTVQPNPDATFSLGTPSFRWKTLNGVNPGALSLPSFSSSDPTMLVWSDLDTTNWLLDGTGNAVSIALDGYVYVSVICGTDGYVVITEGQYGYPNCFYMSTGIHIAGAASAWLPVRKGIGITVYCKGTSIYNARFFPMQGNV